MEQDTAPEMAARYRERIGRLSPAERLAQAVRLTQGVRALAEASPDDPAVLAPLFLRLYRLPAGADVRLLDAVPVVLVAGAVDLSLTGPDVDLTVGGLSATDVDVDGFTAALRPTPHHDAAAGPAVAETAVAEAPALELGLPAAVSA